VTEFDGPSPKARLKPDDLFDDLFRPGFIRRSELLLENCLIGHGPGYLSLAFIPTPIFGADEGDLSIFSQDVWRGANHWSDPFRLSEAKPRRPLFWQEYLP
jgi:hypothetical protein